MIHNLAQAGLTDLVAARMLPMWALEWHHELMAEHHRQVKMARAQAAYHAKRGRNQ